MARQSNTAKPTISTRMSTPVTMQGPTLQDQQYIEPTEPPHGADRRDDDYANDVLSKWRVDAEPTQEEGGSS